MSRVNRASTEIQMATVSGNNRMGRTTSPQRDTNRGSGKTSCEYKGSGSSPTFTSPMRRQPAAAHLEDGTETRPALQGRAGPRHSQSNARPVQEHSRAPENMGSGSQVRARPITGTRTAHGNVLESCETLLGPRCYSQGARRGQLSVTADVLETTSFEANSPSKDQRTRDISGCKGTSDTFRGVQGPQQPLVSDNREDRTSQQTRTRRKRSQATRPPAPSGISGVLHGAEEGTQ